MSSKKKSRKIANEQAAGEAKPLPGPVSLSESGLQPEQTPSAGSVAAPVPSSALNAVSEAQNPQKGPAKLLRRNRTPALLGANRLNSLKSTGPLTDLGKMNSRMNALRLGVWMVSQTQALKELGERNASLTMLRIDIRASFQPADTFELELVEAIVDNRWRRRRIVRAESNILAAQRLNFELEFGRKLAGDGRSPNSIGEAKRAAALGLVALADSYAKFNLILQCLRAAQESVEREGFSEEGLKRLQAVYGPDPGLAGGALLAGYCQQLEAGDGRAKNAPARQAFLDSLAGEIACFEKLLELYDNSTQQLAQASAAAQNALSDADSKRITRYEAFLDRQFEKLVQQFYKWREAQEEEELPESLAWESEAEARKAMEDFEAARAANPESSPKIAHPAPRDVTRDTTLEDLAPNRRGRPKEEPEPEE